MKRLSTLVLSRFNPRTLAAGALAGLMACFVYLNALHNPFIYDDDHTVVANTSIENIRDVRAIVLLNPTRPLVNLSYAIDRALWGHTPLGFHLTNVAFHALNVLLLFYLMRRLADDDRARNGAPWARIGQRTSAFAAAAIFAVHPMMTEAVGYVSGRAEVLCATFFLLAFLCARHWLRAEGLKWTLTTVACWIAALTSKETAAMFPFVLVAYDRLALGGGDEERRRRMRAVHMPLVAVAVLAGLMRLAVLAFVEFPGQAAVHWSFVPLALDVIRRYAGLLVIPAGQTIFHEVTRVEWLSARGIMALAALGLGAGLAWRLRRVAWVASFGVSWFFLLLLPQSVLTVLDRGEPMAEHRVYLASCGAFLAVGAGVGWLNARLGSRWLRIAASTALALVLVSFSVETMLRNALWGDPIELWRESVELAPLHYRPRLLLGEALQDAGRRVEAAEQYRAAILRRPADSTGYAKLGLCLAEMGRFEEAAQAYKALEQMEPRSPLASNGLGTIAMLSGDSARAREYFRETMTRDPRNIPARQAMAILAELEGQPAEALQLCREIQQLGPRTPGVNDCVQRNELRVPGR